MRIIVSLLLFAFWFKPTGDGWLTNINKAKIEAAQSNKLILLNFSGSDWCIPCIRLHKEVFESEAFKNYANEHLVLVNADFPRLKKNQLSKEQEKENDALAEQYNPKGDFPLTLLLDSKGKVLKTWEGFPKEGESQFISELAGLTAGSK